MNNTMLWDFRFLQLAEIVSSWSKDPSRKVGSVIVDSKQRVLSLGYNGFPRGVEDQIARYEDRDTKLKFICHAERNALDNAPGTVEGATLYATLFPCNECVKSIIQRGITKVVTFIPDAEKNKLFFLSTSIIMLKESGIELVQYPYNIFERWINDIKGTDPLDPKVEHM